MTKVIKITTHEEDVKLGGDILSTPNTEIVHCDDDWSFLAEKGMYKVGDVHDDKEIALKRKE